MFGKLWPFGRRATVGSPHALIQTGDKSARQLTRLRGRRCTWRLDLDTIGVLASMGFPRSRKKRSDEPSVTVVPPFGTGRRLRSDQDLDACLETIEDVLRSYRPPPYAHLPLLVDAGSRWLGPGAEPAQVMCCDDNRQEFLAMAFWPDNGGTLIGIFPLGGGDERLSLPIIGHWKMRDHSLSSIGRFEAGLLALRPPVLPVGYFEGILEIVGFPTTTDNLDLLRRQVATMFLIKAQEFIGSIDTGVAERFAIDHHCPAHGGESLPQSILDDLGAWNPGVLPYMQDLPCRVRSILLNDISDSGFWANFSAD